MHPVLRIFLPQQQAIVGDLMSLISRTILYPRVELVYGGLWYPSMYDWEGFAGPLNGALNSGPGVSSWGVMYYWEYGRLDVFVKGKDGGLHCKTFDKTTLENGWGDWKPIGGQDILYYDPSEGSSNPSEGSSNPSAVSWGADRIDVFARGKDNALWHTWYSKPWIGKWESLGGVLTSGPSACSWGSGRLDVFVKGTDNALYHKWYTNNAWSGWESLGGVLTSAPSAVSWGQGRIDVFVRGTDNALYHKWYQNGWSNWESLGGVLTSAPARLLLG